MIDAGSRGLSITEALRLAHLPDEGLTYRETVSADWLDQLLGVDRMSLSFKTAADTAIELDVQPLGSMTDLPPILIRGKATTTLDTTCVRCLADVPLLLTVPIERSLFPMGAAEGEEEGHYGPETVDLPDVVREAVLLDLTTHPTCGDEGACDARTAALIDNANQEHSLAVDPRWAPLEALKKQT